MNQQKQEFNTTDNCGRRSGADRRHFDYTFYIPERRSGIERRSGKDRRKIIRTSASMLQ